MELNVGEDNPLLVIIPPGVVHGYKNISSHTRGMVFNYPDRLYRGWGKIEEVDEIVMRKTKQARLNWNSRDFGIPVGIPGSDINF